MKYATQTIRSHSRKIYAEQNEPLSVISVNGLVAIVETCAGNRFPCLMEMLSDTEVVVVVEEAVVEKLFDLFNQ